jgi:hypothetical protein
MGKTNEGRKDDVHLFAQKTMDLKKITLYGNIPISGQKLAGFLAIVKKPIAKEALACEEYKPLTVNTPHEKYRAL